MFAASRPRVGPTLEWTVHSYLPRSRAALCAELAEEFPALDTATIERAVDHAVRVAEELSGDAEPIVWARAGVFARDHLDLAVHRARRAGGLRRAAPMAV